MHVYCRIKFRDHRYGEETIYGRKKINHIVYVVPILVDMKLER